LQSGAALARRLAPLTNCQYASRHETTLDRVRERSFRQKRSCSLRAMLEKSLDLSHMEYCNEDLKNAGDDKLCSPAAQRRIRSLRATRGWRTRWGRTRGRRTRGPRWLPQWDGDESWRPDVDDGSRRRIQRDESSSDDRNPRISRGV